MSGAMNTQAPEFPQDPDILNTGVTGADEFRDIDLGTTAVKHKADFSSVPNETMSRPVDTEAIRVAERRIYADGPDAYSEARVSDAGARRYSSFTILLPAGSEGYPGEPSMLLGVDASRTRIVIAHGDTSYIIIGPREQVAVGAGLRLSMGDLFETTVQQAVYAVAPADAVNPITVSVWAEYA